MTDKLRDAAEDIYAAEIKALIENEAYEVPRGWCMSPRSVLTYICGGKAGDTEVSAKFIGHKRLIEIAIATLLTDRSLVSR